jgi:predicted nucleic acid-binding protein
MVSDFPGLFPGLPPTDAEQAVRQIVARAHASSATTPITGPDSAGAFLPVLLPGVFPLVVDSMTLRSELLRTARHGRTILANAANSGALRLFVARHVVDEVGEHFEEWAGQGNVDPALVWAIWKTTYVPLLRCVSLPTGWLDTAESERLARLTDPNDPNGYGDPDDVPTATLALLLGAPLLSKDKRPLRAVYGDDFDRIAHIEWLSALRAGGDLGPLGEFSYLSTRLVSATGYGIFHGIRALVRNVPWQNLVIGGALVALGSRALVDVETRKRIAKTSGHALIQALELFVGVNRAHASAERQYRTLAAAAPAWERVFVDVEGVAAIGRLCLFELSRAPRSCLSAVELDETLAGGFTIPGRAEAVANALRASPCFQPTSDERYQVGRSLQEPS